MPSDDEKNRLVRFLERRAFGRILRARNTAYSEPDRKRLEDVKRKTEQLAARYRAYDSAGQVRQMFEDDLRSPAAKRVHSLLRHLRLPALPDVAEEFFALADRLGVSRERRARTPHRAHPPHPWHKKKPPARRAHESKH
jgi:hypothetical protein